MSKKFLLLGSVATAFSMMLAVSANAATSYLGSSSGDFGTVDTDTGVFTKIGTTPQFSDIAILDETTGFGVTISGLFYSIDLVTAATTFLGNTGTFINGLGFDDSGNLFGTGGSGFYGIDVATGAASLIDNIVGFSSSGDLAYDGSKFFLSSTSGGGPGDTLFSINADGTGETNIGGIGFSSVFGLTYQDEMLFGFTANGDILNIDTTTGAGTDAGNVAGIGGQIFGAAPESDLGSTPDPESTPEPAGLLGLLALSSLAVAKRRLSAG